MQYQFPFYYEIHTEAVFKDFQGQHLRFSRNIKVIIIIIITAFV